MNNTDVPAFDSHALLAIWHDVEASHADEYLRWHTFEHLPERLSLPGFRRARRYKRNAGWGPEFLCLVDTSSLSAFSSKQYLDRVNAPTAWTRSMMPRYSNVSRVLCLSLLDVGGGTSPVLCCIRFNMLNEDPSSSLPTKFLQEMVQLHVDQHVTHIQVCVTDAALSARGSEESRLRGSDRVRDQNFLILLAGISPVELENASELVIALLTELAKDIAIAYYDFSYASTASTT